MVGAKCRVWYVSVGCHRAIDATRSPGKGILVVSFYKKHATSLRGSI
jgi:hypothetical protein